MKKNFINISLLALPIIFLTSCATLFKGSTELNMASSPENAKVYLNDRYVGTTPLKIELSPDQTYSVRFEKEGFKPVHRSISKSIGAKWIILDVVGGLVPLVVDAITGKWYDFEPTNVSVSLHKD